MLVNESVLANSVLAICFTGGDASDSSCFLIEAKESFSEDNWPPGIDDDTGSLFKFSPLFGIEAGADPLLTSRDSPL